MSTFDVLLSTDSSGIQSWERRIFPTEFVSLFYDNGAGWSAIYEPVAPGSEASYEAGRQSGGIGGFEARILYWDTTEFVAALPSGAIRETSYFRFGWSVIGWSTIWPASLSGDVRTTNTRPATSADVHAAIDDTTITQNAAGGPDALVPMGDVSTWSTGAIFGFTLGQNYEPQLAVDEALLTGFANAGPELAIRWAVTPRPGESQANTDHWVFRANSTPDWPLAYVIQYAIEPQTTPPTATPIYHTAKRVRAATRQSVTTVTVTVPGIGG